MYILANGCGLIGDVMFVFCVILLVHWAWESKKEN